MGEDYKNFSKEELITKLKSKDEQIVEMSRREEVMGHDFEKALLKEREHYSKLWDNFNEYKVKTMNLRDLEKENMQLKETIVTMAVHTYSGIAALERTVKEIDENLKNINKGR